MPCPDGCWRTVRRTNHLVWVLATARGREIRALFVVAPRVACATGLARLVLENHVDDPPRTADRRPATSRVRCGAGTTPTRHLICDRQPRITSDKILPLFPLRVAPGHLGVVPRHARRGAGMTYGYVRSVAVTLAYASLSHVVERALRKYSASRLPRGDYGSFPPRRPFLHEGGTYARCESATHPGPGNSNGAVGPSRLHRRRSAERRQSAASDASGVGDIRHAGRARVPS